MDKLKSLTRKLNLIDEEIIGIGHQIQITEENLAGLLYELEDKQKEKLELEKKLKLFKNTKRI